VLTHAPEHPWRWRESNRPRRKCVCRVQVPFMSPEQGKHGIRLSPAMTATDRNSVFLPCSCVSFVSRGSAGVAANRGSRQRSSCGRGLGSVCADGAPSGGRQRASGGESVVAEADRPPCEDLGVRAHRVAADRTEEPGELSVVWPCWHLLALAGARSVRGLLFPLVSTGYVRAEASYASKRDGVGDGPSAVNQRSPSAPGCANWSSTRRRTPDRRRRGGPVRSRRSRLRQEW
jgi:hypothetical protein